MVDTKIRWTNGGQKPQFEPLPKKETLDISVFSTAFFEFLPTSAWTRNTNIC